jgi:hypothetical protein
MTNQSFEELFYDFATPFVVRRLPAWGRIFLEKSSLMDLNKNFPAFMGTVNSLLSSQHPPTGRCTQPK